MPQAVWLYHLLPYPLKRLAASLHGRRLRDWRFGSNTDVLCEEALARDAWPGSAWPDWQTERVSTVLARAAQTVPHYRSYWQARGERPSTRLADWPVLSKETLRADSRRLLADDRNVRDLFSIRTSGTTGTPLQLWWSAATARAWYALYEARIRRWNGVTRADPLGLLGGQLVTAINRRRPPFWVWIASMNQLYLSTYHISRDHTAAYLSAMRAHGLRHLVGYPSALAALARFGTELGVPPPRLAVVITNAEPLQPSQRQIISSFFRCDVRDTYGMAEAAAGASECKYGALHIWPEAGVIEVLDDDDQPVAPGEPGRLIVTGLLHDAMPLIRYEVGDFGALDPSDTLCPCGSGLPRFASVDGRADDLLRTHDGRVVGRMDPVFKDDMSIREAQIIQESLDLIVVRVVPGASFGAQDAGALARRVRERMGEIEVQVVRVEAIERGPNGKFKAVISRLPTA